MAAGKETRGDMRENDDNKSLEIGVTSQSMKYSVIKITGMIKVK